ncbi:hypothetical protein BH09MYX1_BH09MYX1_47890 [soil metagenome]
MTNRVRWVKSDDPDAADAAPTVSNSPVTWERATKVLAMGEAPTVETIDLQVDADDTNPVPAISRKRLALVEATEEIAAIDVLEVAAPSQRPRTVSISSTCEIQVDDVIEEVTVPKNRDRKTDPPASRDRKTEPPSPRNRKTEPPMQAIPRPAAVPHFPGAWAGERIPPAPLPSTPPWVSEARPIDSRHEATRLHTRPPSRSRGPWIALGALAGAAVAAMLVFLILPPSGREGQAATARAPTLHNVLTRHGVERLGHGRSVPVLVVGALPSRR